MLSEHPSEKQTPLDAGAQRIARWRSLGREQLKQEQATTERMRRMKTRIKPLSGGNTGAIPPIHTPQPNPATPWHGCGDDMNLDIFDTPTMEIKAVTPPKTEDIPLTMPPVKTRVRNHASDVAPEEECVHVIGDKWHYDSPNHAPDRATLNAVIERYHADLNSYPEVLEASEGLCGNLMLQQLLHIYNGEAFYLYVAAHGKVHPVRIQPNFWSPFWCISSRIPSTDR